MAWYLALKHPVEHLNVREAASVILVERPNLRARTLELDCLIQILSL